jgi:hypothetical protein
MEKQQAWDYALGIIKVDGLEPSPEFLAMAEKEKRGELTLEDIRRTLDAKYTLKPEYGFSGARFSSAQNSK